MKKEPGFEEGLKRLEILAEQMENSELPLEELLKLYEEGMKLTDSLTRKLETVKGRMLEIQRGKDGKPKPIEISEQTNLLNGDAE